MMKKSLAFSLLLILLTASIGVSGAEGLICDLSNGVIKSISAETSWNCTYKEEQVYTLDYHVAGIERNEQRQTTDLYYRLNYLSPGTDYVLTVSTYTGGQASIAFTTPEAADYARYHFALLGTGLYKSRTGKKDYEEVTAALSGKTLPGEIYDYDYSFMFQFTLTASDEDKSMHCTLVLHLPNGDAYSTDELVWYTHKSATLSQYVPFSELLQDILGDYGEIPAGGYTLNAYFDGENVAETTFTVE
jgi:hypothetical protein